MSTPGNQVTGYVSSTPPKNARATSLADLVFQPGISSNAPGRDIKQRWAASNRVRFHEGLMEKIGGWIQQALTNAPSNQPGGAGTATYVGTCRAATDWASLDGQQWIAFATECKLYLINNFTLYDITPVRKNSNVVNVFSTTSGSATVTVSDTDHRANVGDHMSIIGPSAVGGLTLNGDYDIIAVIDPNTYQITAASNASATVSLGGGSVSLEYDISCGLAANGQLLGYGTGEYGEGTYGTPRQVGTGVPTKLRTWSLWNWGQDLIASYNGGEIYWWQWTTGPNSRAALIANAPTDVQRLLVDADRQFAIALGASDVDGGADPMNVRWCSEGDLTDWLPTLLPVANTAGGQRLNFGSRMVTAIQSRQQNLLWSDTQMYQMQFVGGTNIFSINELGSCYVVGPNAVIDVNGVVYMMCVDNFFIYDGTLRVLECDMWETVFGSTGVGFDRTQSDMVYCSAYKAKSEVMWLYPANDGYDTMQYVVYNYDLQCWYGGTMPRTCYHDTSAALEGYLEHPYGFNGGYLYLHEIGYDENEGATTNPMYFFARSWDISAQSDKPYLINSLIPEFQRLRNGIQFSYLWKEHPTDAYTQVGPFILTPDTAKVDERCSGTQIAILLEAPSALVSTNVIMLAGTQAIYGGTATGYIANGYPNGGAAMGSLSGAVTISGYAIGALFDSNTSGFDHIMLALLGAPNTTTFTLGFTDHSGIVQSLSSVGAFQSTANGYGIWEWTLPPSPPDTPFVSGETYTISTGGAVSEIVLGCDFRLGVWQSMATPHGKRLAGASRGSPINTNNP